MEDLRIIKTKKTLSSALLDLMKEKSFEEIKVSDICSKALINRSTFYAHYSDKYELLSSLINDLKISLIVELKKNQHISNSKEYYLEMLRLFLNHVEQKSDVYASVVLRNKNSILIDMIYTTLDEDIKNHIEQENEGKIPSSILSKFYLGAVFNVGIEWLYNKNKYSKEEILSYLDILIPED
jgi:AcrR family transcriptional regulator